MSAFLLILLSHYIYIAISDIVCTPGQDCIQDCSGGVCGARIDCADNYHCSITCNGLDACDNLKIYCNTATNCEVTCDGTATDTPCSAVHIHGENTPSLTFKALCGTSTDDTYCAATAILYCPTNGVGSCVAECDGGASCTGVPFYALTSTSFQLISRGQYSGVNGNLGWTVVYCPNTGGDCTITGDDGGHSLTGLEVHVPTNLNDVEINCIGGGTCFNDNYPMKLYCSGDDCLLDENLINQCDGSQLGTVCDYPMGYHLLNQDLSWTAAQQYCIDNYGTSLATIRSQTEYDTIAAFSTNVWIGLNDKDTEGNWLWSDGNTPCLNDDCLQLPWWNSGEPDGDQSNDEDCASWDNGFQDDDCGDERNFVCNDRVRTPIIPTSATTATPTTSVPTKYPTTTPTKFPTKFPTTTPSKFPTTSPTKFPSQNPSNTPTIQPTGAPTKQPSRMPSQSPSSNPSTAAPATIMPTTAIPTTSIPTTSNPTTLEPTTNEPTSSQPTTHSPTTNNPTSSTPIASPTEGNYGEVTDSAGNPINSESFTVDHGKNDFLTDNILLILIVMVVTLVICIVLLIFLYRKRNRKSKAEIVDNSMELARVGSTSTNKYEFMENSPNSTTSVGETRINTTNEAGSLSNTNVLSANTSMSTPPGPQTNNMKLAEYDALGNWLSNMKLIEYYDIFVEQGFGDRMEALCKLSDADLKEMGIYKLAHRREILSNVAIKNDNINSVVMTGEGVGSVTSVQNSLNSDGMNMDMEMDHFDECGNDGTDEELFTTAEVGNTTKGDIEEYEYEDEECDANDAMYAKGNVTSGQ